MVKQVPRGWVDVRREWGVLNSYERFEAAVALLLTAVIGAVILVALARLVVSVVDTLVFRALNPPSSTRCSSVSSGKS